MTQALEKPSLASIIREAWQANSGDMPGAAAALYLSIVADAARYKEIAPTVLLQWCRDQIGDHVGAIRLASIQPVDDASRGGRLRSVIAVTLFDFPLPGGKRLGDASAAEIRDGAGAYDRTAADAAHKARWLAAVAERVGRKNKAENALTLEQLTALFEEAEHG